MLRKMFVVCGLSLVSVVAPEDAKPAEPRIGQRVVATRALDYLPHAMIKKGEEGTIAYVSRDSGMVEIRMDDYHAGLGPWDNHIWLMPFDSDEVVDGIRLNA